MEILHLSQFFLPEYSGTTTRLYNILSHQPFAINLLVSDRTIQGKIIGKKRETINNIHVERISNKSPLNLNKIAPFRYYNLLWHQPNILIDAASKKNWDIIHVHDSLPCRRAGYKLHKKSRKPLIVEFHIASYDYSQGPSKVLQNTYLKISDKQITHHCDRIITLSNSLSQWISKEYRVPEEMITVVPNGVDSILFAPDRIHKEKADKLKQEMGIRKKIILYAGYLDSINGIPFLLKVIPQIMHERNDAIFIFIGHGPEEEAINLLSKKYPHNIKILTMVPYDEMPIYYEMCDLFVIPRPSTISSETLTPLKLLEAMAMEKPVLASNVGGMSEIIVNGENGYLYQKNNLNSFIKTLHIALDSSDNKIGKNARRTVVENYRWDKSANILRRVYEDLI